MYLLETFGVMSPLHVLLAEEVGGTYEEGSVMKVEVGITAYHNGQFLFRICRINAPAPGQTWAQAEKAQMTNECFNQVCWAASG